MRKHVPYRLLVAAIAVMALAPAATADDGYLLRRVYKAGDTDKFKTTLKIQSGSEEGNAAARFDVTLLGSENVKEINPDGSAVVEYKMDKATVSFAGQERELPDSGQSYTQVIDKEGAAVPEKKVGNKPAFAAPGQMLSFMRPLNVPSKPLKAGDEHKFESNSVEDGKTVRSVKGVMTVVGLEKKGAELPVDAVKVKVVMDGTVPGEEGGEPQKVHVDTLQWIEPDTGRVVMVTGKVTGIKIRQFGDATIEIKRVRVSSGSSAKSDK